MSAIKTAAKTIHEGYNALLKGHKGLTISHKSVDDNKVSVSISGSVAAIESAHKALLGTDNDLTTTLHGLKPEGVTIYQAILDRHDGPKAEKESDQTQIITIHHTITTH